MCLFSKYGSLCMLRVLIVYVSVLICVLFVVLCVGLAPWCACPRSRRTSSPGRRCAPGSRRGGGGRPRNFVHVIGHTIM